MTVAAAQALKGICRSSLTLGGGDSSTLEATGAAGSNETNLLAGGCVAAHSGGVPNVLVVTTTVGVLHRIHSHTTHLRPAVALHAELVVGVASLQQGLFSTPAASHLPHHRAACARQHLLGAGRQLDAGDTSVGVVRHHDAVVPGRTRQAAAVTRLLLHVADDSTLGHVTDRLDVADVQRRPLASVQELARVHALRRHEELLLVLEPHRVPEGDPGEGSATGGVVQDLRHHALDVAIALGGIQHTVLGGALPVSRVRREDAATTLAL
eukprot:CAMPEP_0206134926 /NCGR_PEP_ID=MMETSP1473-20131121/314_1 /ASSEMBLY_ACC=CAM_ASM_001109 /TAXON_ID=1461547 /ORGANISM="Stichococcus sp, Strain RCC1054" /LENGTH=266 /DNA_ID=CAMNT_0053526571 /DNA_START=2195 /DNA_END=2996 /DNA_ORIENTATION=+